MPLPKYIIEVEDDVAVIKELGDDGRYRVVKRVGSVDDAEALIELLML